MGNIAGVSVAISIGGPGAIFWMWVSGIIGMSTKFFTSSLAIMFRGKDSAGNLQDYALLSSTALDSTSGTEDGAFAIHVANNATLTERVRVTNLGNVGIGTASPSANADLTLEGGALALKEIATPTADANYGKVYTKTDNKLYFQDGAGTEHEIAYA